MIAYTKPWCWYFDEECQEMFAIVFFGNFDWAPCSTWVGGGIGVYNHVEIIYTRVVLCFVNVVLPGDAFWSHIIFFACVMCRASW